MNLSVDNFIEYENENGLFNRKVLDFFYWGFIRHEIYTLLFNSVKFEQNVTDIVAFNKKNHKIFNKFLNLLKFLKSIFCAPFFMKKKDILLYNCVQRSLIDNRLQCRITFLISNHFSDNINVITDANYYTNVKTNDKYNMDFINLCVNVLSKIDEFRLSSNVQYKHEAKFLQSTIKLKFNINLDVNYLAKIILKCYNKHNWFFKYFSRFLNKIKPKCIVYEYHYNYEKMTLNEVSNNLGIPTVELQHGVIGKGHLAYNFGKDYNINILPQKIFFWGDYWKDSARFPLQDENKYVIGFPYHDNQVNSSFTNYENIDEITILVISQADFSNKLISIIVQLVKLLNQNSIKFKLIYRLHPLEYNIGLERFANISKYNNVYLSQNLKESLYTQLALSKFVIGMASTVLYEATSYDCGILIYKDNDYSEYSKPLVDNQYAHCFNNPIELYNLIMNLSSKKSKNKDNCFFKPNSYRNTILSIEEIIKQ